MCWQSLDVNHRGRFERKPDASVVTETDRAIQTHICQEIRKAFPGHAMLGEETLQESDAVNDPDPADARFCWVIDPLDGTRNYIAGFPIFGTSIAVLDHGRPVVGVVAEHNLGQVYAAVSNGGATLNGKSISVEEAEPDHDFLVAVPSTKDETSVRILQNWIATEGFVLRNTGSTAHHLAMVASGSLAAAFSKRSKIWDIAAGVLLIEEAGGRITGLDGRGHVPFALDADPNQDLPFLAGAPNTHTRLLEMVRRILD